MNSGTEGKKKILVVDDEPGMRRLLAYFLGSKGYEVTTAVNGEEGIRQIRENRFDLVLTDYKMPGQDGVQVLGVLYENEPGARAIVMTGMVEERVDEMEKRWGVTVLQKPFEIPALLRVIQSVLA